MRLCVAAIVALAVGLGAWPCGAAAVRVGVYENDPLVFTGADGRPQGIYVDILEHIASQEGWRVDYVAGSFEECLERLERAAVDLVVSVAYSEERAKRYDLSRETVMTNWGQVYTREGSNIESVLDLAGRTVAVIGDDIYEREFTQLMERFGVRCRFLVVADYTEVLAALAEGQADAGVTNRLHVQQLGRYGGLKSTPVLFAPIELRFAAPKGQGGELLATLDRHLAALKKQEGSAYHQAIARWLGGASSRRRRPWPTWVLVAAGVLVVALGLGSAVLGAIARARTAELRESNAQLQQRIAEQTRAEQALRKAERERAIVLDTVSEVVTYHDTDRRIVWCNRAAADMAGMPLDELVGRHCYEIWEHRDQPCDPCAMLEAIETGEAREVEETLPDGREIALRVYPVHDDKGQAVGTVMVGLEMTERKRMEQQLVDSEREKALILASVSELVSFQDTDLRVRWANRAAAESMGLELEDLVGRHCYEIWNRSGTACEGCPVQKAIETGEPQQAEMTTPEGRVWDVRGYPVHDDQGRVIGAVEVTQEITERRRAEEAARAEAELRRALIDASPAFFVAIDREGKTRMMNESMLVALGYSSEEVAGTDYLETFVPQHERGRMTQVFRRIMELKAPTLNENHVVAKDGRERLVEWHGRPVLGPDGQPDYFFGMGMDITERRRAEDALRREVDFRSGLIEDSPAFIITLSIDSRVRLMNRAMLQATGYTWGEVEGTDYLASFVPERERDAVAATYARMHETGESSHGENHIVTKDGRELLVEWHGRLGLTADGEPDYLFGVGIDVTEQRAAQEALRASEARYRAIVEDQTELVCRFQPDGTLTFVNDAYCHYFGRSRDELLGHSFFPYIHPSHRESVRRHLASITPERPVATQEQLTAGPNGASRWHQWTNHAILDDSGQIKEFQAVGRDITQRRQAEEELRRHRGHLEELVAARTAELQDVNRELEAFAYSVSHDLRAPLRAMEGFADRLVRDYGDRLEDEGRDSARAIAHAAHRMDVLIQDLLAYSRVGRTEMPLGPTSLEQVIEEALMQLDREVQETQARVDIPSRLPHVLAHQATLAQAVTNLLSNAIKFVAPGVRPLVHLRAERREGRVRLWVEDNGVGVPPDHVGRVFHAFVRLHGADAYPGTGLGLTIVRRGIERMGGQVGVECEPGKGSRFWIELPAAEPTA